VSDPAGRYQGAPTYRRTVDGERAVQLAQPRLVPVTPTDGTTTVGAGERSDLVAARVLGDPYAWWRLADANPHVDVDGLDTPGRRLDLPRERP